MEDHKKVFSTQILLEVKVEVVKLHFEVDTKARMVDIIRSQIYKSKNVQTKEIWPKNQI
jgi:DUF4097 and DUF4098 domain-containing protein YvlB